MNIKKGKDCLKEHANDLGGFGSFCANCGTRLMNYAPDKSMYLAIALSTVDTLIDFLPGAHVNIKSKAWHEPYGGIPACQGIPKDILD